jgi:hypothetical protein
MKQCMMGEVAIGTNPCMAHGMPKAVTKACGASARTGKLWYPCLTSHSSPTTAARGHIEQAELLGH